MIPKDKETNKTRTIDFIIQLIIAVLIPLALLMSSSLIRSASLSFLESFCSLVAGPVSVALLLFMGVVDLLFFNGIQNRGWPSTHLQTSLLVIVTIVFRAYLLRLTLNFGRKKDRRFAGHFLNFIASVGLALIGAGFIVMIQQ